MTTTYGLEAPELQEDGPGITYCRFPPFLFPSLTSRMAARTSQLRQPWQSD